MLLLCETFFGVGVSGKIAYHLQRNKLNLDNSVFDQQVCSKRCNKYIFLYNIAPTKSGGWHALLQKLLPAPREPNTQLLDLNEEGSYGKSNHIPQSATDLFLYLINVEKDISFAKKPYGQIVMQRLLKLPNTKTTQTNTNDRFYHDPKSVPIGIFSNTICYQLIASIEDYKGYPQKLPLHYSKIEIKLDMIDGLRWFFQWNFLLEKYPDLKKYMANHTINNRSQFQEVIDSFCYYSDGDNLPETNGTFLTEGFGISLLFGVDTIGTTQRMGNFYVPIPQLFLYCIIDYEFFTRAITKNCILPYLNDHNLNITIGIRNSVVGYCCLIDPFAYLLYYYYDQTNRNRIKILLSNLIYLFYCPFGITISIGRGFLMIITYDFSTSSIVIILRLMICWRVQWYNQGTVDPYYREPQGTQQKINLY